jgi:hypothetical protein
MNTSASIESQIISIQKENDILNERIKALETRLTEEQKEHVETRDKLIELKKRNEDLRARLDVNLREVNGELKDNYDKITVSLKKNYDKIQTILEPEPKPKTKSKYSWGDEDN